MAKLKGYGEFKDDKEEVIVEVRPKKDEDSIIGKVEDPNVPVGDWEEYEQLVEEGVIEKPREIRIRKRPDYEFNVDKALDNIDLMFNGYKPSKDAIEFFNIIRLVLGGEPEVPNSLMHYFLVDLVFDNITRDKYPYSKEINDKIRINSRKIAIIAARFSAKSTIITAYLPIYVAITGKIPNFGDVMFVVGFGDSQKGGAKVQANTIRDFCEDSEFCKGYFEKMRFTDEECEFIRKGTDRVKKRSFMYKVKGASSGVRGIRYRTERPSCHVVGTTVTTEFGTYTVEEHPYQIGKFKEECLEVSLRGLTAKELVSYDHKYWAKKCVSKQVRDSKTKKLVREYIEYASDWVQAKDLTTEHWIGARIDNTINVDKLLNISVKDSNKIGFKQVHIANGMLWRKIKSTKQVGKLDVVPIECNNTDLKNVVGTEHAYETLFGISKNCIIFDDIIKTEADANSKIIMDKLRSMIFADAQHAMGSKKKMIAVNTPFNKRDPVYSALESGVWTPVCLPLCEKVYLGMPKSEYVCSWPQMHPYEEFMENYEDAYYSGTLRELNQELMLRISSEEDKLIKEGMVQWYSRKVIVPELSNYTIVVTTDFTASNSKKGDFSGAAVWAISANDSWFLLDLNLRKYTMQEQYDALFRVLNRWSRGGRILDVGVEIDGQQQLNVEALKAMMIQKNFWFRFAKQKGASAKQIGISSRAVGGNKLERFKYSMPHFEMKKVFFPEEIKETDDMKEMLEELAYLSETAIGCISADTKVITDKGMLSIRDVQAGDTVISQYNGSSVNCKVTSAIISGVAETYTITLPTGDIHLTIDHRVLTNRGYVCVKDLEATDYIITGVQEWNKSQSMVKNGQLNKQDIINPPLTLEVKEDGCTVMYMNKSVALSQKVWIFITRTIINRIIQSLIWKYYQLQNIKNTMRKTPISTEERPQQKRLKEDVNWLNWPKKVNTSVKEKCVKLIKGIKSEFVKIVVLNLSSKKKIKTVQSTVHSNVGGNIDLKPTTLITFLMAPLEFALSVVTSLKQRYQINIGVQKSVHLNMKNTSETLKFVPSNVHPVELSSYIKEVVPQNIVLKSVEKLGTILENQKHVSIVEQSLYHVVASKNTVLEHVRMLPILKIIKRKKEVVYDLQIEHSHNFTLANGAVVHNSSHDDGIDLISQMAVIDYVVPNNETSSIRSIYDDADSEIWEIDNNEDEDLDYNRSSMIF